MGHAAMMAWSSLAIAAGCGAMAWRILSDERQRSAARVRALAAAIDGGASPRQEVKPAAAPDIDARRQFAPAVAEIGRRREIDMNPAAGGPCDGVTFERMATE